jgi:protein TonB
VNAIRASLAPFLIVSSAFHLLLALSWYVRYDAPPVTEHIPVTIIPPPPEEKPAAPQAAREAPSPPQRRTAQVAKKSPPAAPAPQEQDKTPAKLAEKDKTPEPPLAPKPRRAENETIVARPLPTLKDLLPPVYSSYSEGSRGSRNAIALDSREPRYVSYLTSLKQAIESEWIYPSRALRYGLQGKLRLEFTILRNGRLEEVHLIRSSGSHVLDEEAVRAVRAAAPYRPLPAWMGERQSFTAGFEYNDNRLKYSFAP